MSILNKIQKSILDILKKDVNIQSKITEIYQYAPKTFSLPYINLHINGFTKSEIVSNTIIKINMVCEVYSFSSENLFEISYYISEKLENYSLDSLDLAYTISTINNYNIYHSDGDILQASLQFFVIVNRELKNLEFKIKFANDFMLLSDINILKIIFRNKVIDLRNIKSSGWRAAFNDGGNKYISFNIQGSFDDCSIHRLLLRYSLNNKIINVELSLQQKEKILTKCVIELYEKYYDKENSGKFNMLLASDGKIAFIEQ